MIGQPPARPRTSRPGRYRCSWSQNGSALYTTAPPKCGEEWQASPTRRARRWRHRLVGELEVALEHLGDAVHASVAERAATGQDGEPARPVAVDAAVLHEAVGLPDRAEPEDLQPEVDERREAVVQLRQVDVARSDPGAVPQAPAVSAPTSMMSSSGQCSGSRCADGDPRHSRTRTPAGAGDRGPARRR